MITGISTYDTPKERECFALSSMRCTFENRYRIEIQYDKNSFFRFYFSNVHISVNNEFENVKLGIHVANIHVEGRVSQIFSFRPSFISCNKTGNFLVIFLNIFPTFYKKRMRTCMKNLRHSSLYSNVFSMYQQFQAYNVHSKGGIHVQKIKVKKYIFVYSYPI